MSKNNYINGLMSHHASLMSDQQHRHYRQWAFIVCYFCWDNAIEFDTAKGYITEAVNKRTGKTAY